MMNFNDFTRSEKQNPAARLRTEAKLSPAVIQQLNRAKLLPANAGQPDTADILSSLSQQIVNLNNSIVGDPSCALVVKRLSEMILRLYFLTTVNGDEGSNG
ncbi:MAG: hypothetical protein ACR2JB_04015 [Bryobacteraceae bacterium]